jgi:autotransporter strand-loop-strand O-heptosyltransferase
MKIVNVTPGLLPIPPNGWGAVEKIIWESHLCLLEQGHHSKVLYLDGLPKDADVVHIHVANLANMAHERGIPYYFTMHDHHAYLYGKDSHAYRENLQAIRNAVRAFVPAKYLVDWFEGIPEYFSHGVNTEYFTPAKVVPTHSLLCVANNGFIHDQSEDRKGFGLAIETAKRLGLPITIAGPKNNRQYFEKFPSDYNGLTVLYDLPEDKLKQLYQEHTIFLHPSVLEAGHPNLTLLEAMASGLPVVGTYEDGNSLRGMVKVSRNADELTDAVCTVLSSYIEYRDAAIAQANDLSWKKRMVEMVNIYKTPKHMREKLLHHYKTTVIRSTDSKSPRPNISINNIDGLKVDITDSGHSNGNTNQHSYRVDFIDRATNKVYYTNTMPINHWSKANKKCFVDWEVKVYQDNELINEYRTDYNGARVFIALDSRSLGDTLAWIPYVEEFRKKHNCRVVCSTFWNHFFKDEYPEIEFVDPGYTAHGIHGMYVIGYFYKEDGTVDYDRHNVDPKVQNLQEVAASILGIPYTEIVPKIRKPKAAVRQKPYVTIGYHSTCQTKYWNNPKGWQEVVDYLISKGIEPVIISKEGDGYMGNTYPKGVTVIGAGIEETMELIAGSEFFIGISSGLSWLSWALRKHVIMISGFTEEKMEFSGNCTRIINKSVCNGCWSRHKFDPGDWNWCPDQKGTPRQFECTKTITGTDVIRHLEKLL